MFVNFGKLPINTGFKKTHGKSPGNIFAGRTRVTKDYNPNLAVAQACVNQFHFKGRLNETKPKPKAEHRIKLKKNNFSKSWILFLLLPSLFLYFLLHFHHVFTVQT